MAGPGAPARRPAAGVLCGIVAPARRRASIRAQDPLADGGGVDPLAASLLVFYGFVGLIHNMGVKAAVPAGGGLANALKPPHVPTAT